MGERVLVVGNGGRECTLASQMLADDTLEQVIITPPNVGVIDYANPGETGRIEFAEVETGDHDRLVELAGERDVDLVVVGPEKPLVHGLADRMREAGISILGPGLEAAQLEGSKSFADAFMQKHGIPSPEFRSFEDSEKAKRYLKESAELPVAVKADGLAGGKGVRVTGELEEALEWVELLMQERKFGEAGEELVIEEALEGPEISFHVLIGGDDYLILPPVGDYKRLRDGDEGPNTGGMGTICPPPWAPQEVRAEFEKEILEPFMDGIEEDDIDYRGVLFFGTMHTDDGLKVLEFNVRYGDPEAQVLTKLLDTPLYPALKAVAEGDVSEIGELEHYPAAAVCVMLASEGYPFESSEPARISGLSAIEEFNRENAGASAWLDPEVAYRTPPVSAVFSGVSLRQDEGATPEKCFDGREEKTDYMATGGRVLGIVARGDDLSQARLLAYQVVNNVGFRGAQCRSDIGKTDDGDGSVHL